MLPPVPEPRLWKDSLEQWELNVSVLTEGEFDVTKAPQSCSGSSSHRLAAKPNLVQFVELGRSGLCVFRDRTSCCSLQAEPFLF